MNGVTIGLGVTFASYVGMGFYFVDSPVVAWRAPMGIPLIGPLLILCSIAFLPESPRFLLLKERSEQARRIFDKLNTSSSTDDASLNEEFNQMELQAAHDRAMDSSWKSLVTNPVYRKRIFLACVITALNQSTGVLVINNYGQTFYQTLGFSPTDRQLFQGNRDTSKCCPTKLLSLRIKLYLLTLFNQSRFSAIYLARTSSTTSVVEPSYCLHSRAVACVSRLRLSW